MCGEMWRPADDQKSSVVVGGSVIYGLWINIGRGRRNINSQRKQGSKRKSASG